MSVIAEPDIRPIAVRLLEECWTVGKKHGADVEPSRAAAAIDRIVSMRIDGGTSMLTDTVARRPTEYDAIYGAILRKASEHEVEVPTVSLVHALLGARRYAPSELPSS